MIRLLILCLTTAMTLAASSPEIASKSAKTSQNQQQQEAAHKVSSSSSSSQHDDPMLNAINAYAHQYDTTTATAKSPQYSQQLFSQQITPSHQLPSSPTIESNFQPIPAPHQQQLHSLQTPFIMQYLPQSPHLSDGGVQYLQLIPTQPLLVPVSPYMSPMAEAYKAPHIVPIRNDIPGGTPETFGGLQTYASTLHNYRGYRFNRETKPSNIPDDLRLNLNEFMPSPNDALTLATRVRGRP